MPVAAVVVLIVVIIVVVIIVLVVVIIVLSVIVVIFHLSMKLQPEASRPRRHNPKKRKSGQGGSELINLREIPV